MMDSEGTPLLRVENLAVNYGGVRALKGISLDVPDDSTVAVIGANGAGKSTTLRAIAGLAAPNNGRVQFQGDDVTAKKANAISDLGIRLVPETRELFPSMTVMDNLRLGALRHWRDKKAMSDKLREQFSLFPSLEERRNVAAGLLSGGEQQMLALARALMGSPRLLLLDEPSTGLAPALVKEFFDRLAMLKSQGTTILIVEQLATKAIELADYVYVLELGRISLEGSPEQVAAHPDVLSAYLGNERGMDDGEARPSR